MTFPPLDYRLSKRRTTAYENYLLVKRLLPEANVENAQDRRCVLRLKAVSGCDGRLSDPEAQRITKQIAPYRLETVK